MVSGGINTFTLGADRGIRSASFGTDIAAGNADRRLAGFFGTDGIIGGTSLFAFFTGAGGYRRLAAGFDAGVVKGAAEDTFFSGSGVFGRLAFTGFILALAVAVKDHFAFALFAVCGSVFELVLAAAIIITQVAFVSGGVFLLTGVEGHIAVTGSFHIILLAVVVRVKITVAALAGRGSAFVVFEVVGEPIDAGDLKGGGRSGKKIVRSGQGERCGRSVLPRPDQLGLSRVGRQQH